MTFQALALELGTRWWQCGLQEECQRSSGLWAMGEGWHSVVMTIMSLWTCGLSVLPWAGFQLAAEEPHATHAWIDLVSESCAPSAPGVLISRQSSLGWTGPHSWLHIGTTQKH